MYFCLGQADIRRGTGASRIAFFPGESRAWHGGIRELTFRQAADDYLAANRDSWKCAKHRQQWENSLATHVHPIIGDLPIKTINRDMVVRVLQPIWHDKPETSRRIRMRIETIVDYAIARKVFNGDNPAALTR